MKISLTASMSSNLLSLQQTQRLMDATQLRLSTGLKVNSAIDNPSNFYTASSLSNRASDLSSLLDSMSQAIQTVKAAGEAIESATKLLTQAKAVANGALEFAPIELSKQWYINQAAKQNGAVVSTVAELDQAIADNKSLIVVYGKIDYTQNKGITLNANQKLVGTEYFADINQNALYRGNDNKRISELNFKSDNNQNAINLADKTLISDLSVSYENSMDAAIRAISVSGIKTATIKNIDVNLNSTSATFVNSRRTIAANNGATINIEGSNNINAYGNLVYGVVVASNSAININGNVNIKTSGNNSYGVYATINSTTNINGKVNIQTSGANAHSIIATTNSIANINGKINISMTGSSSYGILNNSGINTGSTINIASSAEINIASQVAFILNHYTAVGTNPNTLIIEQGAKIAMKDTRTNVESYFNTKERFENINTSTTTGFLLNPTTIAADTTHFSATSGRWPAIDFDDLTPPPSPADKSSSLQYQTILTQYDQLISDAGYKGVNLLQLNTLSVTFNEGRTSKLDVTGVDAGSQALGLNHKEWQNKGDVQNSLAELDSAINQLRSFASNFGNNYSIIENRQEFTKALISTLTEGADKLTLADMNEESANMLALQTRQQLAINSLSLAAQASQSVLKLF